MTMSACATMESQRVPLYTANLLPEELALTYIKKHITSATDTGVYLYKDDVKDCTTRFYTYDQLSLDFVRIDLSGPFYYHLLVCVDPFLNKNMLLGRAIERWAKYGLAVRDANIDELKKLSTAFVSLGADILDGRELTAEGHLIYGGCIARNTIMGIDR